MDNFLLLKKSGGEAVSDKYIKQWSITRDKGKLRFCFSWSISSIFIAFIVCIICGMLLGDFKLSVGLITMLIFFGGVFGAFSGVIIWNRYERLYLESIKNRKSKNTLTN